MDELLRQLADLALGSIPTVILFIVLVLAYRFILYGPLMKVRAERRERTVGAMERAQQAIAAADVRAQEYAAKLRAARLELFSQRERRVKRWNAERDAAVAAARVAAQERVRSAQLALAAQAAESRRQLETSAGELATAVMAAVLPSAQTAEISQ